MFDQIKSLHLLFCEMTNSNPNVLRLPLFERAWWEYLRNGFTEDDLRVVLKRIIKLNAGYTIKRKLTIRAVVEDLPRFCEDLAEARRIEALRATPKEKALGELRGAIPERKTNELKSLGELVKKAGLV